MYQPITGTGNGSAPVVNLTWPYLDRSHVKASVNDVDVSFIWTGSSQITFSAVVANGATWKVYRQTPKDAPLVDFTDGAVLLAEDLDLVADQLVYIDQEVGVQVDSLGSLNLTTLQTRMTTAEGNITTLQGNVTTLNSGKSDVGHQHAIADVTNLQSTLDAKLDPVDVLAGANVTVTNNGNGTITIASAGAGGGATLADGDYGDVAVTGTGTVLTVQTMNGGTAIAPASHNHDTSYYTKAQVDTSLAGKSDTTHTHDTRYYTQAQVDTALAGKSDTSHTHDTRYYTQAQVDTALAGKTPAFTAITSFSANRTIADADNNGYLKATGSVALTITLNATPTAGMSAILVNRSSQPMTLSAASGMYKNSATATATSGTIAAGGSVVLFHEGAGVWAVKGDVT